MIAIQKEWRLLQLGSISLLIDGRPVPDGWSNSEEYNVRWA